MPGRVWVVDTDLLARLAQLAYKLQATWTPGAIHITEWVRHECLGKPAAGQPGSPEVAWALAQGLITVHPDEVGDDLWLEAQRLHGGGDKNRGENELIALCLTRLPEALFVSRDKAATYGALVELGPGRVASPFDCWHDLIEHHGLPASAWPELCKVVQGFGPPPRLGQG